MLEIIHLFIIVNPLYGIYMRPDRTVIPTGVVGNKGV
jgi:hypothetical protein